MILEDSHNFIFVEIGHPMKQSIQISSGVTVECLANRVDRDMIVDKFDLISVLFERLDHIIFLITK